MHMYTLYNLRPPSGILCLVLTSTSFSRAEYKSCQSYPKKCESLLEDNFQLYLDAFEHTRCLAVVSVSSLKPVQYIGA